jgi:hypothetical protein
MGKCSDLCYIEYPDGTDHEGYVPKGLNIGGDDFIRINLCLNCGKIAGDFPVEIPKKDEDDY